MKLNFFKTLLVVCAFGSVAHANLNDEIKLDKESFCGQVSMTGPVTHEQIQAVASGARFCQNYSSKALSGEDSKTNTYDSLTGLIENAMGDLSQLLPAMDKIIQEPSTQADLRTKQKYIMLRDKADNLYNRLMKYHSELNDQ